LSDSEILGRIGNFQSLPRRLKYTETKRVPDRPVLRVSLFYLSSETRAPLLEPKVSSTVSLVAQRIDSDPAGFNAICTLHAALRKLEKSSVNIDMSAIKWLGAHLAVPLAILVKLAENKGNVVSFVNTSDQVALILRKNQFFSKKAIDTFNTTMPIRLFPPEGSVDFSRYSKRYLDRREMPKMTRSLREKFYEGIDELFANSALHSKTGIPVAVGGQFYPNKHRLDFALGDGGRGIQGAIRDALKRELPAEDAIEWAMQPWNTTRQGDIPGGLGSQILTDFVKLNKGKLIVVSNAGYWSQNGGRVQKCRLAQQFPGTVVVLEIDTADRNSYDLAAPRPQDIW
jgi:hypothetical protein